jgi:hypothetical protein
MAVRFSATGRIRATIVGARLDDNHTSVHEVSHNSIHDLNSCSSVALPPYLANKKASTQQLGLLACILFHHPQKDREQRTSTAFQAKKKTGNSLKDVLCTGPFSSR